MVVLDEELHVRAGGLQVVEMALEKRHRIKGVVVVALRRGASEEEREEGGERVGHGEETGGDGVEIWREIGDGFVVFFEKAAGAERTGGIGGGGGD